MHQEVVVRRLDMSAVESRVVRSSPHRVTAGACPDLDGASRLRRGFRRA